MITCAIKKIHKNKLLHEKCVLIENVFLALYQLILNNVCLNVVIIFNRDSLIKSNYWKITESLPRTCGPDTHN